MGSESNVYFRHMVISYAVLRDTVYVYRDHQLIETSSENYILSDKNKNMLMLFLNKAKDRHKVKQKTTVIFC